MRKLVLATVLLFGCSGGDEEDTGTIACVPAAPPIRITVVDPDGNPISDASVEWDGVACTLAPGAVEGVYACTATPDGANQLTVIATNMRAYSEFLEVPAPVCAPPLFEYTVTLQTGIA